MNAYRPVHAPHLAPVVGSAGSPRWTQRPAQSNWGDFGPDDQLGRLNYLTADKVKEAAQEIQTGERFCLSLPLDKPGGNALNPRRHPPVIKPSRRPLGPGLNFALSRENPLYTDVVSDDYAEIYLQYSTQWDALSHVGSHFDINGDGVDELVYYNGFQAGIDILAPDDLPDMGGQSRAKALGVERLAEQAIQGRGVLVNLRRHFGDGHTLVSGKMLKEVLKADGIEVTRGDIVALYTGFSELLLACDGPPKSDMPETVGAVLDGRDPELQQWIIDSHITTLVADNYGIESVPGRPVDGSCAFLPLHELCLFKLGMPFGELWYLHPLAQWLEAHGRYRFMLTAPALRLPGAVGSPVTPVATV
ncbi:cyclase family protein [Comamonas sp. MYb21]|uniref:cyclase family protein n=1 Tax=unclassified Comamonas TaxID=2638500 RepID=UPI0030AC1DF2